MNTREANAPHVWNSIADSPVDTPADDKERTAGKADIHTHSKYSSFQNIQKFQRWLTFQYPDSVSEPEKIVDAAEKKGLDVVCITDHNCIKGGVIARRYAKLSRTEIDVVVGEEVSTADGEILGLFLECCVPHGLSAERTIELIHDQGGLAIAAHPYSAICDCVRDRVLDLPIDGAEVFNASHKDGYSNALAVQKTAGLGKALCGGSDAHNYDIIGMGYTTFEGSNGDDFRKAIERRTTAYGGTPVSISQMIRWSETVALKSMKMLLKSYSRRYKSINKQYPYDAMEPLQTRINMMQEKNKILSLFGSLVYTTPPLPLISGLIGDSFHRKKSREVFERYSAVSGSACERATAMRELSGEFSRKV